MGKWIAAIAAVGIVVFLILIWLQLHSTTVVTLKDAAAPPTPHTATPDQLAKLGATIKAAEKTPDGKLSPNSDDFFYRFSESQPKRLSKAASSCYTGGINRVGFNDMLKIEFTNRIHGGEVTISDVRITANTISNKALVDCFIQQVTATHWHDDDLPDLEEPDELVFRPEQGMKKYKTKFDDD
jgi:hypothetical protein